jgi:hypothetical protein
MCKYMNVRMYVRMVDVAFSKKKNIHTRKNFLVLVPKPLFLFHQFLCNRYKIFIILFYFCEKILY